MNKNSFSIKTIILKSNHEYYEESKYKKLNIINKLGEGSYGFVFLLDNTHVIKIFKNSNDKNTILIESNYLLPIQNENRELIFYYKYKNQKKEHNYIINLYSIGIIRDKIIDKNKNIELNSYFIILPYCIPFYNIYNILNKPLINNKNGINFTLNVMKRLSEISKFFELKYGYINLDFKLNNFMFSKNSSDLNDLIMIDFSIIKNSINKKIYNINNKYYIWPYGNNINIDNIIPYSISVNGLELLFGYNKLKDFPNKDKINKFLKIIHSKNIKLYNIFYNCLYLNYNIDNLIKSINTIVN
jgi:hypothetical protein